MNCMGYGQYKYGMLNRNGEVVVQAKYDKIYDECYSEDDFIRVGETYTHNYGTEKKPNIYYYDRVGLINAKGEVLLEPEYNNIVFSSDRKVCVVCKGWENNKQYAVYNNNIEMIIPWGQYDVIEAFSKDGLSRVKKDDKWGVINTDGNIVVPVDCDDIWRFDNKPYNSIVVVRNCIESRIPKATLLSSRKTTNAFIDDYIDSNHAFSYDEHAGSYAQDYGGLDDETINDAFDGDPDAYWNID